MSDTPRLSLPFLAAGQAQKHVTHNDALMHLDALVHISVVSRDEAVPPASPAEGERRHIGAAPEGAWAGQAGRIAELRDGGWLFHTPQPGWVMWVETEGLLLVFDGAAWRGVVDGGRPDGLQALGLGTGADAANPFAAKLNKALWTARGTGEGGDGDLRMTFNKELAGNVLSLLFQAGYSGRAEIGLVGGNDLQLRVSDNGSDWREALRIDGATGALQLLSGTSAAPTLAQAGDADTGLFFPAADTVAVATGGGERLRIAATGAVSFPTIATTASAANAFLDGAAGNGLLRSTSSRRYKRDIEPLDPAVADRVLDLAPVYYRSTAARDPAGWSWYGLVAEEVAEIDPRLVHWGHQEDQYEPAGDGAEERGECRLRPGAKLRPDAVQYDRLGVLLIDVVRRQRAALAELESRVTALENGRDRSAAASAAATA
jgi:hypothetical protein